MSFITSTLLWCALQTTLLALMAAILCSRPLRVGGSSGPFFGLLGVALLTLLSFFPVPYSWNIFKSLNEITVQSTTAGDTSEDAFQETDIASADNNTVKKLSGAKAAKAKSPALPFNFVEVMFNELQSAPSSSNSHWPQSRISQFMLILFSLGLVLGMFRLVVGLMGTRQLRRTSHPIKDSAVTELLIVLQAELGLRNHVEVFESEKLTTAATLGALKPVLLLPRHWRTWSTDELRAVIAHELAHIHHRDFAALLVSQVSVVLHFYNPLIHWLSGRLRLEQELAADSVAARLAGGQRHYVRVLAKLALDHENQNVGWPARAFLPTRHTFLRRLEMLRDSRVRLARRGLAGRLAVMGLMVVAIVALLGIKPPGRQAMAQGPGLGGAKSVDFDTRYVSDSGFILAAHPSDLFANPQLAEILQIFKETPQLKAMVAFGIEIQDIEQLVLTLEHKESAWVPSVYIKASKPITNVRQLASGRQAQIGSATVTELPQGQYLWQPDERSMVINSERNLARFIEGRGQSVKLLNTDVWKKYKNLPIALVVDSKFAQDWADQLRKTSIPSAASLGLLWPIVDESEVLGAGLSLDAQLSVSGTAQCSDDKGVKVVQETLAAAVVVMKSGLREMQRQFIAQAGPGPNPPGVSDADTIQPSKLIGELCSIGSKFLDTSEVKTSNQQVSLTMKMDTASIPLAPFLIALQASRLAAERMQSANNIKQIALAFHNFESTYQSFPSAAHRFNPASDSKKPPCSWRVAILPYIEQNELYSQYNFDEPWDSENNLKLLPKMPAIYRHPQAAPGSTETSYVVLTGEETIFAPAKNPKLASITDGTSNTIMIVETKTNIPWTKPEDVEYSSAKPLPKLGGFSPQGFHVGIADGSVRFLGNSIEEKLLRALITARGGELIQ